MPRAARLMLLLVLLLGIACITVGLRQGLDPVPKEDAIPPPPANATLEAVALEAVVFAVKARTHVVIDARPHLFWRTGHVPGAISLPRKHFAEFYPQAEPLLRQAKARSKPLLVYCSDSHCPDSAAVGAELIARGFGSIQIFEEGWHAWEQAAMPVETR